MTTYKLEYPITLDSDNPIFEVECKRLKVKDMKSLYKLKNDPYAFSAAMIGLSTGLTIPEVDEMDAADNEALSEIISGFLSHTK